jgi:hypothetical protein
MQKFLINDIGHSFGRWDKSHLHAIVDKLPKCTYNGPWLAGGSLRRTLSGESIESSDLDFFFKSAEQCDEFERQIKEQAKLIRKNEFNKLYNYNGQKIQLVHFAYHESIEALLDSFDFTICQFAFDGEFLYCGDSSLWDLARKKLAIHKVSYGLSTTRRLLKYQTQGYYACSGCITTILESIADNRELIHGDTQYID